MSRKPNMRFTDEDPSLPVEERPVERPYGVPQVGVLKDVKNLPWRYQDYDRWTNATQRGWALDWLRTWLPEHPLLRGWWIDETFHLGRSALYTDNPVLIVSVRKVSSGKWFESSIGFNARAREEQDLFVERLALIGNALASAAGA